MSNQQMKVLEVANLLRSLYTSGKKPHQIAYLILLHYKKDLSVDEFTYFMDGFYTPNGKPLDRSNVYSHLYALDKANYIYKQKMLGEYGKPCNVYFITPKGQDVIQPILDMCGDWNTVKKSSTLTAMFGTRPSPEYKPISEALQPEKGSPVVEQNATETLQEETH